MKDKAVKKLKNNHETESEIFFSFKEYFCFLSELVLVNLIYKATNCQIKKTEKEIFRKSICD